MMRFHSILKTIFFITLTVISLQTLQGQSVSELEQQRKQTLKNLETTNKMLNETKKSQKSSITKLTIINKNIKERKTLITNINHEIGSLDNKIQQLDQEKHQLESRLTVLKRDYTKLVQEAHINRSLYAKIMFILSAESFDQSYRRLRYLQEYTSYRKDQVNQIEKVKTDIVHKNDSLQVHKTTKIKVVKQKETEAQKLKKDEQNEKVLLTDLQKKEKKLRADLKIQQKKAAEINSKIERIIAEQIRKEQEKRAAEEKKRLEAENRNKPASKSSTGNKKTETPVVSRSSSSVSMLTKEETLLAGNFERNMGRLPWPTSNGFISGHYGIQQHPVLIHVTTNNKGIYIQTPAGSSARAVFDGVVTQRFSIPGSNNAVIIQHGNYRTVYANLTQIFVNEGQKVTAKQPIGKIYTDDEKDNKTELYFQIWKDKTLQNPEIWIAR